MKKTLKLLVDDLLKEHSIDGRLERIGMKLGHPSQVGMTDMKLNRLNKSEVDRVTATIYP
ncbi:hypothetical protein [Peribacillus phoenicis]|uniref:hypothetical protein n=1 Tax=unclassified Peribacillus TaxID=2675266 RepID=UPI00399FB2A7